MSCCSTFLVEVYQANSYCLEYSAPIYMPVYMPVDSVREVFQRILTTIQRVLKNYDGYSQTVASQKLSSGIKLKLITLFSIISKNKDFQKICTEISELVQECARPFPSIKMAMTRWTIPQKVEFLREKLIFFSLLKTSQIFEDSEKKIEKLRGKNVLTYLLKNEDVLTRDYVQRNYKSIGGLIVFTTNISIEVVNSHILIYLI